MAGMKNVWYPPTPPGLLRRHELRAMTDDAAAVRVPRVVGLTYETAADEAVALARVEQQRDPALSAAGAFKRVFERDRDLYDRYQAESQTGLNLTSRPVDGQRSPIAFDRMQVRAKGFNDVMAAKQAAGLSPADAARAAAREDPEGYRCHVLTTTLCSDGSVVGRRR